MCKQIENIKSDASDSICNQEDSSTDLIIT